MMLYFIPNVSNAIAWITFSPIAVTCENAYDISAYEVIFFKDKFIFRRNEIQEIQERFFLNFLNFECLEKINFLWNLG